MAAPKRGETIPAHLTMDEMNRLLEMPDTSSPLGRRDRAILELFYASGLRLSELVGLDLEDVNVSARMVRVLGKGRKERLVPFNTATADAIRAWLKDRAGVRRSVQGEEKGQKEEGARGASAPLFLNYRGGRLSTRSVDRLVRRYVARVRREVRHQPARAAPLIRDAPALARRRPARDPGTARPRAPQHHAAVHARERGAAD